MTKLDSSKDSIKKDQYLLKATFVRRRLRSDGYYSLLDELNNIIKSQGSIISWKNRSDWGISSRAWKIIRESKIEPLRLFCHPKILNQYPTILLYYRSVAILSQKGFHTLTNIDAKAFEAGKVIPNSIKRETISKICIGLNQVVSNTLEQGSSVSIEEVTGFYFAQAGSTLDGSWRNQIGNEGQLLIWGIIARSLLENNEIHSLTPKDGKEDILIEDIDKKDIDNNWETIRSIHLLNGATVGYSYDPDIVLRNNVGDLVGAIEVKAGLDPAGALERAGAVLKSFESILGEWPNAITILVTSCETTESRQRFNESDAIKLIYITTDLTVKKSQQRKFLNQIKKCLGLLKTNETIK